MTDITDPSIHPEKAAMQLIVELIRAQRVPVHHDNVNNLLSIYDQAVSHFKTDSDDGFDDSPF